MEASSAVVRMESATRARIVSLETYLVGKLVWIRGITRMNLGNDQLRFIVMMEQGSTVQAVVSGKASQQVVELAAEIENGWTIEVHGEVCKVQRRISTCTQQDVELVVEQLVVVSKIIQDFSDNIKANDLTSKFTFPINNLPYKMTE